MNISNSLYKETLHAQLEQYRNSICTAFYFACRNIIVDIEDIIAFKLNNKTIAEAAEGLSSRNKKFIIENYNKIPVDLKLIQLYKKKCEEAEILLEFVSLDLIKFIEVSYLGLEIIKLSESTIKLIILLPNIDIGTYTISKEGGPILTVNSVEFRTRTDVSLFIINGLLKRLD